MEASPARLELAILHFELGAYPTNAFSRKGGAASGTPTACGSNLISP